MSDERAQLERINQTLAEIRHATDALQSKSLIRDWGPVVAAVLAAGVAIFSLVRNLNMADRTLRDTLREKAREEERKSIREKIDQFYGPFVLLRGKSRSLYTKLFLPRRNEDARRRFADAEGHFRTVVALSRGESFTGADRVVLDEIVQIGKQTAELIQTKMGLVEDKDLRELLSYATAHYWVIEVLLNGKLTGGGEEVEQFVFPSSLDARMEAKLNTLNQRLSELTSE